MTTQQEAEAAIDLYGALVARAVRVVAGAPFWKYVSESESGFACLSIEGETATLVWPEASGGLDEGSSIEPESCSFPVALLFISDDELAAWRAEQRTIYERVEQARLTVIASATEARERAVLAQLKAKYEPA